MASIPLTVDVLLFAAFAPLVGVILLWFLQLLCIEVQKRIIVKIAHTHEVFCRFTNFLGILFQSICQALGYTMTRSGLASFQVTVNSGTVTPKREKKGAMEWIAHSFLLLGPFFIPSAVMLLILYFIIDRSVFLVPSPVTYSFVETLSGFGESLLAFTQGFVGFLTRIDLFNAVHVGVLFALLFFGFGIRPSYVGEARKTRIDMRSDLENVIRHLRQKPLYVAACILVLYVFYLLSILLNPLVYRGVFSVLGWMSLTAVIALLLTYPVLLLLKATDSIAKKWKKVPFLTLPLSYILARIALVYTASDLVLQAALLVMILVTTLVTILLIKYKKTNRFKTGTKMKHGMVTDGKKRTSKKGAG